MTPEAKAQLLIDIKADQDIKWSDADTDKKLNDYIDNGVAVIKSYSSSAADIDFTKPGKERELLFAYVSYARNKVLDMFKVNYKDDLIGLRLKYQTAGVVLDES